MKDVIIKFRDELEIQQILKEIAGPFGDMSKVARAALRLGLEQMGYWPISEEREPEEAIDSPKSQ
jgi:Arc/MetJ-type ribon-helix-helix transcriptional regulator